MYANMCIYNKKIHDKLKSKCTIGQEGEQRKSYSAAVIDGIKINSRIYVG